MSYFAIISTEDGAYFEEVKDLDEFFRENVTDPDIDPRYVPEFMSKVPGHLRLEDWPQGILLIKGEIVIPKPVQVVTKFEVP